MSADSVPDDIIKQKEFAIINYYSPSKEAERESERTKVFETVSYGFMRPNLNFININIDEFPHLMMNDLDGPS